MPGLHLAAFESLHRQSDAIRLDGGLGADRMTTIDLRLVRRRDVDLEVRVVGLWEEWEARLDSDEFGRSGGPPVTGPTITGPHRLRITDRERRVRATADFVIPDDVSYHVITVDPW